MTPLAEISKLTLAFQTKSKPLIAVDEISFCLNPGETLALLGESGCGKSLTALGLMRLLPMNAVYGNNSSLRFDNEALLDLPEFLMQTLRGRRLAIIFQEPMTALNPVLTIGEQLREALPEDKRGSTEEQAALIALLQEVEIPQPEERLKQYPHQLSGGQKQRIMIAMALARRPDLLIADEPTTALDVTIQAQILDLLKKLQARYAMSILLITHDLGVVKAMADRVCVMYAGQIVEQADVDDYFSKLLHPYSQQLLASLPDFSKRNQRLQSIAGSVPALDSLPTGCRFHPRCSYVFSPCYSVEPELINMGSHEVRCHLYPEHQRLPILQQPDIAFSLPDRLESEAILLASDISVTFQQGSRFSFRKKTGFKAVDEVSFSLYKGKTLALVGESGSGKTTLGRVLAGLQAPDSGYIQYRGQRLETLRGSARRLFHKKVQIIFQDPFSSMNPRMTVGEIIAEGMQAQGFSSARISQRQKKLLDQIHLPANSLSRYPHQFSGGQRQRICIARALACEPEILICDEPTSALDISVQAQILNLLRDLQEEHQLAYLFISHNMSVVAYLADEIMVMREGKIIEKGSTAQILTSAQESYTKRLLAAVLPV